MCNGEGSKPQQWPTLLVASVTPFWLSLKSSLEYLNDDDVRPRTDRLPEAVELTAVRREGNLSFHELQASLFHFSTRCKFPKLALSSNELEIKE